MKYIDEKFKAVSPAETVEKIKSILHQLDIQTEESWNDSGIDNCWSLNLYANDGTPSANGKGITEDFARASAYAEFIERIQGGLCFYKFQDIIRKPEMYIQSYAPDIKYVTAAELEENGEWMDYIIDEYGGNITRKSIVKFCKLYGCTDGDKIATLPFYSLFEDRYVYLPIGFVDQIYGTNGCCAGNTRNEAWVHALSEMMERRASLKMLTSGESAPYISQEVLDRYPIVTNIINQVRESGKFDIQIFDYSLGNGFPVISTRIINKETQDYRVNVAADPVLEIAIQRTLTEMFQGKSIKEFFSAHNGRILKDTNDYPLASNVLNQLETSSGIYTADFFAEEITCTKEPTDFAENSDKTNDELLKYMLGLYKELGKPVYVRNFSYLGFHSYRFIVPGFSEAKAVNLQDILPDALSSEASKILKDISAADEYELNLLLKHSKSVSTVFGRQYHFSRLVGLPFNGNIGTMLISITRSYAAYKLKIYDEAVRQLNAVIGNPTFDKKMRQYFACVARYITLIKSGISEDKIRVILYKFFEKEYTEKLYAMLDSGKTPYDEYLLKCDLTSCDDCKYRNDCVYNECREMTARVGAEYQKFTNGQDRDQFKLDFGL